MLRSSGLVTVRFMSLLWPLLLTMTHVAWATPCAPGYGYHYTSVTITVHDPVLGILNREIHLEEPQYFYCATGESVFVAGNTTLEPAHISVAPSWKTPPPAIVKRARSEESEEEEQQQPSCAERRGGRYWAANGDEYIIRTDFAGVCATAGGNWQPTNDDGDFICACPNREFES